jgi:hypothetical protein
MTMKRGIGLLLAIFVWGCGTSYDAKKSSGKDASAIPGDAVVTDVAASADLPIGASTETGPKTDTAGTNRDNGGSPDVALALDAAPKSATPQAVDTQATLDQGAVLDSPGASPDAAGTVDGSIGKKDAAPDAGGSLPDVSFTLPDVSFTLPDVSFTLPDVSFTLPDLGVGGNCTTLAACCPSLASGLQSTCNTVVSNNDDTACAALIATLSLLGSCR